MHKNLQRSRECSAVHVKNPKIILSLPLPRGEGREEGGSSQKKKSFSSITLERRRLETPNSAQSKFNNRHIGEKGYNKI